jgi:hypothetical protein
MLFSMTQGEGMPLTLEIRALSTKRGSRKKTASIGVRRGDIILCENALIKLSCGDGKAYEVDSVGSAKENIERHHGNGGGTREAKRRNHEASTCYTLVDHSGAQYRARLLCLGYR